MVTILGLSKLEVISKTVATFLSPNYDFIIIIILKHKNGHTEFKSR